MKRIIYIIIACLSVLIISFLLSLFKNQYVSTISSLLFAIVAFALGYSLSNESNNTNYIQKQLDNKESQLISLRQEYQQLYDELHDSEQYKKYQEKLENTDSRWRKDFNELCEENDTLHKKVEDLINELIEQPKEIYQSCYLGLKAIEKTFIKLGIPYDMQKCIEYHNSIIQTGFIPDEESEYLTNTIKIILDNTD